MAVLHGSLSSVITDNEGQIGKAHSISAGLDYPGVGPEHAYLRDSKRAKYVSVGDSEALSAFKEVSRLEGIIPALETAHAFAWAIKEGREKSDGFDVISLSGRGDKDLG
jgi:tryptophan synthase beta chain